MWACAWEVYMPLFFMLAVALSRRQYKEAKEKRPLENLIWLWKCLASALALDESLILSLSGILGALSSTFPLRQQNPSVYTETSSHHGEDNLSVQLSSYASFHLRRKGFEVIMTCSSNALGGWDWPSHYKRLHIFPRSQRRIQKKF